MDPRRQFCQNPDCPDRGRRGRGTLGYIANKSNATAAVPVGGHLLQPKGHPFIGYEQPRTWLPLCLRCSAMVAHCRPS